MDRLPLRWILIRRLMLVPGGGLLLLALLMVPQPACARTWIIHADFSGDAETIQAGINSAAVGDTVLVWPGTYYENVDYLGKDIVLLAKYGPEVTTIDGSSTPDAVVTLGNGESRAAILKGFTITGGQGSTRYNSTPRGGGIMCYRSSPTIQSNRIVDNHATVAGGMAVGNAQLVSPRPFPLIEGNLFEENTATGNSGAISIEHADVMVRKNVFRRNACGFDGGAIRLNFGQGSSEILINEFIENEAGDHGGGLYVFVNPQGGASVNIQRNLFVRNVARAAENVDTGSGGGAYVSGASGSFSYNTLVANIGLSEINGNGGGLLLEGSPSDLEVRSNIIALSVGYGIACRWENFLELGPNLLWSNGLSGDADLGPDCAAGWLANQIIADPLFCNPAADDFHVASNSPAMTGEEVMGAYGEPGCGPGVAVQNTTWGRLKALYH